jgi:excisionase family DNA binding protein
MPIEPNLKGRQRGRGSPVSSIGKSRRKRQAPDKPLLSVEEAAEMLGQSRSSLYRAIKKGSVPLPVYKIGGRYRIPRAAVERLLNGEPLAAYSAGA